MTATGAVRKARGNAVVVPSADIGAKPQFSWLPLEKLVVDDRYQRSITGDGVTHINRIVRTFCWSQFQPLTVTGPDGSGDYPVIDGQHRLEAARRHPLVTEAPCWIVEAPKIADQARAFVAVNKTRIAVTRVATFWAALAANDADAVWLRGICDEAHIAIGRASNVRQPPRTTIALAAIQKLRGLGDAAIVAGLSILAEAQPDAENVFRAPTILAVTRLVARAGDGLGRRRLVSVLADMDLDQEVERARGHRKTFGGNTEAALQFILVRAYNKRLLAPQRLEE